MYEIPIKMEAQRNIMCATIDLYVFGYGQYPKKIAVVGKPVVLEESKEGYCVTPTNYF